MWSIWLWSINSFSKTKKLTNKLTTKSIWLWSEFESQISRELTISIDQGGKVVTNLLTCRKLIGLLENDWWSTIEEYGSCYDLWIVISSCFWRECLFKPFLHQPTDLFINLYHHYFSKLKITFCLCRFSVRGNSEVSVLRNRRLQVSFAC